MGPVKEAGGASANEILQPCSCCQGEGVEKISIEREIFSHRLGVWGLSIGLIFMFYWILFGSMDRENIEQTWGIVIITIAVLARHQFQFRKKLDKWRRYKYTTAVNIKT